MGWSCTAAANDAMDYVMRAREDQQSSNSWPDAAGHWLFYDIGRENDDGAITAQVYRTTRPAAYRERVTVRSAGGLRIEPDGYITRWPGASHDMRTAIRAQNATINQRRAAERERAAQKIYDLRVTEDLTMDQAREIARKYA